MTLAARSPHFSPSAQPSPQSSKLDSPDLDSPNRDADLIIVGAGIVGATLACALLPSGLRIALVDAQLPAVGLQRRRAYAFSLLSSEIFQTLGVWEQIRPQITACSRIRLSDGAYPRFVWLSPEDLPGAQKREAAVYVAEHDVLLRPLYAILQQAPQVDWYCPMTVAAVDYGPERAIAHLTDATGQTCQITSRLIIAADGPQSSLRQAAQISTRGWNYWQSCIGFTVRTEKPHGNTAYERFWPSGPFAILPLPDQRAQVVWTAPHAEAQRIAALPEAEFLQLLETRYGTHMGRLTLDDARQVFPVRLMQSDRYSQHRLALVGDAAHNCHPVGGQGLNMGIRDAAALAQILTQAHQHQQDIGQARLLRRYEHWRKRENWVILAFTDLLDRLFSSPWPAVIVVRRWGLWLLRSLPFARTLALGLMAGQLGRKPLRIIDEGMQTQFQPKED